jgi:hypothetical protein
MATRCAKTMLVALMSAVLWLAGLGAQPKGERVTLTGEPVDAWCYLEAGDRGPAKKQCATDCAKAGNPIALVDAKGTLYLVAGLKSHQPAHALLIDRMNETVTVTGILVQKGGVRMLYVDSAR